MLDISTINPFALPSLPIASRKQLPSCPAVYFVICDSEILYIGKASRLVARWVKHHRYQEFQLINDVQIAWFEVSDRRQLLSIESALINHFNPLLNNPTKKVTQPLYQGISYRDALIKTFDTFGIVASEISKLSGVGENQISNYRTRKTDLYSENLQALINALPLQARMYFYGLLLQCEAANEKNCPRSKNKAQADGKLICHQ